LTPLSHAGTPDGRALRVSLLLIATAIMCLGDLAMTMTYITSVGMVESNPIARAVMEHNSPAFVVVWKLTTMGLGLGILYWTRRAAKAELATWLCFLVMAGLCIHWLDYSHSIGGLTNDYNALALTREAGWVDMSAD